MKIDYGTNEPDNFEAELFDLVMLPHTSVDKSRRDLEDGKELWSQCDLQTHNYATQFERLAPPGWRAPILVFAQEGSVVDRIFESNDDTDDSAVAFQSALEQFATPVQDHFNYVNQKVDQLQMLDVYQLNVVCNPWIGHPTSTFVGVSEAAFDEQMHVSLKLINLASAGLPIAICTVGVACCEEDCCGAVSRWGDAIKRCIVDVALTGFDPAEGRSWDCKPLDEWECCESSCCVKGAEWDGNDSCLGST